MKLLAIDIGNTKIHFGLFADERLKKKITIPTNSSSGQIRKTIALICGGEKLEVIAASVVPDVFKVVKKIFAVDYGIKPVIVSSKLPLKIRLNYKGLGADRIADVVGAHALYGGPLIVVGFGTAITFEVVNSGGDIIGGAIAPGLQTMFSALSSKTALLPKISAKNIAKTIVVRDTKSAIEYGVVNSVAGAVKEIIALLKKSCRLKGKVKLVATGGDSNNFAWRLKIFDHVNPNLTLIGLKEIYNRCKVKGERS